MRVTNEREATALRAAVGEYAAAAIRASSLLGISPAGAEALVVNNRVPTTVAELAVTGKDLLALGIEGRAIGAMLSYLLETVMVDPSYNNKEALLALCESHLRECHREGETK